MPPDAHVMGMHPRALLALATLAFGAISLVSVAPASAHAVRPPPPGGRPPPPPRRRPPPPPDPEPAPVQAMPEQVTPRGAIAENGDAVKLVVTSGGKKAGITLAVGKKKAEQLYKGEAIGTVESGHGKVVVAYAVYGDSPFRIHVVGGKDSALARPGKRVDVPYAIAMTPTPEGFTVLFQDIEVQNTNEAHTYMVLLDENGEPTTKPKEVSIPWALGAVAWNGNGYHLALFYSGGNGVILSMVSMTADGVPQGHPDWSSGPGLVSDVHLVSDGEAAPHIRAIYRGGMGDRLVETDVTKIGQWGSSQRKATDHGALDASQMIAIDAKGTISKLTLK